MAELTGGSAPAASGGTAAFVVRWTVRLVLFIGAFVIAYFLASLLDHPAYADPVPATPLIRSTPVAAVDVRAVVDAGAVVEAQVGHTVVETVAGPTAPVLNDVVTGTPLATVTATVNEIVPIGVGGRSGQPARSGPALPDPPGSAPMPVAVPPAGAGPVRVVTHRPAQASSATNVVSRVLIRPGHDTPRPDPVPKDSTAVVSYLGSVTTDFSSAQAIVAGTRLPGLRAGAAGIPARVTARGRTVLHGRLPG